jgi:acetylornithine aminotransferase
LNIHPDIVCLGSNTANGYPLGAMMMAEHFADTEKSREDVSLASCSAAVATLALIHQHGLPRKAEQLGNFLKHKIADVIKDSDEVKGIRGLGLMIEIEFFNEISALKFHQSAFKCGLVTGVGNVRKRIIRLTPPLTIDGNMAEELLTSFRKAFSLIFP